MHLDGEPRSREIDTREFSWTAPRGVSVLRRERLRTALDALAAEVWIRHIPSATARCLGLTLTRRER